MTNSNSSYIHKAQISHERKFQMSNSLIFTSTLPYIPFCDFICHRASTRAEILLNIFFMFHPEYNYSWVIIWKTSTWQLESNILMVAETWEKTLHGSCQYSADRGYSYVFQKKIFNLSATSCQNFWMNREEYSQSPRCSTCRRPCTQLFRNNQAPGTWRQHIWRVCVCMCVCMCGDMNFLRIYIDVL